MSSPTNLYSSNSGESAQMDEPDLPPDDPNVGPANLWYPAPEEFTFAAFESFVVATFEQLLPRLDDLKVQLHERIEGIDGEYDFDATVRFSVGCLAFVVLVEAKCHKNPIKREVAQILASKMASVGAHKSVIVSTAPFQKGAISYARTHGIALIKVTEGRFIIETKSVMSPRTVSVDQARFCGIPDLVGHNYEATEGGLCCTLITGQPEYATNLLLGLP